MSICLCYAVGRGKRLEILNMSQTTDMNSLTTTCCSIYKNNQTDFESLYSKRMNHAALIGDRREKEIVVFTAYG